MKKYLAPIIVAGFLCGNLALSETERQEIVAERQEINEEYVYFYEMTISNPELTDVRRVAYKNSYRTFIIDMGNENAQNDPYLYEGLLEE